MTSASFLFDRLAADLQGRLGSSRTAPTAASWATREPVLDGIVRAADAVACCGDRTDPAAARAALSALLRLAADDRLAAEAALGGVIPALRSVAAELARVWRVDAGDIDQEVATAGWERVLGLAGRTVAWADRVIAWGARDTVRDRLRVAGRRPPPLVLGAGEEARLRNLGAERDVVSVEAVELVRRAVRRGVVSSASASIVWELRGLQHTAAEVVARRDRQPAAVTMQCLRAESSLRRPLAASTAYAPPGMRGAWTEPPPGFRRRAEDGDAVDWDALSRRRGLLPVGRQRRTDPGRRVRQRRRRRAGGVAGRRVSDTGFGGSVSGADLRAVLSGTHPVTGAMLVSPRALAARRRPGLFLTFSAPKGVSLLGALGDDRVASAVDAAHAGAVRDAIGYLEGNALWARRGGDGLRRVPTGGFVAAGFLLLLSGSAKGQLRGVVRGSRPLVGTRRQADSALAGLVSDVEDGMVSSTDKATLGGYLECWLGHVTPGLQPGTVRSYRSRCERWTEELGKTRLTKVTAVQLDDTYGRWSREGMRPANIRMQHTVLAVALHQAVKWDLVPRAATDNASPPRVQRYRATAPDVETVLRLTVTAAETNPVLSAAIMLAALTGARRGELAGLR